MGFCGVMQHNLKDPEESRVAQEEAEGKVQVASCLPCKHFWVHKTAARNEVQWLPS